MSETCGLRQGRCRRWNRWQWGSAFCVALVPTFADDGSTSDELLRGIDDSRMRLVSGVFRVEGTTVHTLNGKVTERTEENCRVVFDYDAGCYRFERDDRIFLQTPECFYERGRTPPGDSQASITRYELHEPPTVRVNPFDVRNLGFFTCHGTYYKSRYEGFRKFLIDESKVVKLEPGPLDFVSIIHRNAGGASADEYATYGLWVDRERGYTSTRIEVNSFQTSDITWESLGDVFVPVAFRQRYQSSNSGLRIDADWALTWEQVNQPIEKNQFTYQSLKRDTDESAILYSGNVDASGRPVALDIFGVKRDLPGGERLAPRRGSVSTSLLLLFNGIALILLAVVASIVRWKRRRNRKEA